MSCNCHEEYGDTIEVRYFADTKTFDIRKVDAHGEEIEFIGNVLPENLALTVAQLS